MSHTAKLNGYQLWLSSQYRQRSFNQILKPSAITHAQYLVLDYMVWADKKEKLTKLSQNQLAQELSLDAMMISNVLKALETKGYITRTPADQIVVVPKKKDLTEEKVKESKKVKEIKEVNEDIKETKSIPTGNVLRTTKEGKDLIKTLFPLVEKFEKEVFNKVNKKFTKGLESIVDQLSE